MINPIDYPEAWHRFRLGTIPNPGIVTAVSGWDQVWKWDAKTAKGAKKASQTHTGQELAEGAFECALWLATHFDEWEAFAKAAGYNTDKTAASPLKLYYPSVSATGVLDVVSLKFTPPTHKGKGLYVASFSFREWVPAPKKNATVTPTGPKNPLAPETVEGRYPLSDDPIADAQQKQIAELLAQAQKP